MNEHYNNFNSLINIENINRILDAGSGKTSLSYLVNKYPAAMIDAIVYPGDKRKINSIKENVTGNYNLIELDLCKDKINETYDLVLAHLLLGEATKFGNDFKDLLHNLLQINSKYFIIYDFLEDDTIDYRYMENYLLENGFNVIKKILFKKIEEQQFSNFIGKNYIGYLIIK